VTVCSPQKDVVIILDVSGSIDEVQRYGMMVGMARMIVAGLPVASGQARVGAITYDNVATNQFYLTTYDRNLEALLNSFEFNHARATTNTQAALNLARTHQVCGSANNNNNNNNNNNKRQFVRRRNMSVDITRAPLQTKWERSSWQLN